MYSAFDSSETPKPSPLRRLARRDGPAMLRAKPPATPPAAPPAAPAIALHWPEMDANVIIGWVLRGLKWIVVLAILGGLAGLAFGMLATPRYTAYADLVVDPSDLQVVSNDLYPTPIDQNSKLLDVESKLRIATSGNVMTRVVKALDLVDDPEFNGTGGFKLELPFLGGGAKAAGDPVVGAVEALSKKVFASREERSFVVSIGAISESPDKAVKIANAMVTAFQDELASGEAEGAQRAADALMSRLGELKSGVTAAENAVANFRQLHGLETSNGETVSSQSMTLLNSRAIDAQQALIAAQSHYDELTDPATGRANADAVQTPTMVALRTQYGALKQQADSYATTLGPLHPSRAAAERQLAGLQQQISAEATRAVQAAKLELEQARRNVAQLDQQAAAARDMVALDGQAQVQLRELERDAKAKSDVYEAFLARTREVTERQQLDTTNVRVISNPTPPSSRSYPPRTVMLGAGGGFGGAMAGIALALALGFIGAMRRPRTE